MDKRRNVRGSLAMEFGRSAVLQRIPMLEYVARNVNLRMWTFSGRPLPPPGLFKARTLRRYARQHGLRCLVETGTYRGAMITAVKGEFDQIYSIELSGKLHLAARERFAKDTHVNLICGDSGEELARLVKQLHCRALFWLDAHYSGGETANGRGGVPVMKEIDCILNDRTDHVILVDDMRLFGTDPTYPTTAELVAFISATAGQHVALEIRDDILRVIPRQPLEN
jgi:hypothetical protein